MNEIIFDKINFVNRRLEEFFKERKDVLSVFIVGSMYDLKTYQVRKNNDYDIRFLVEKVTPEILEAVDNFEKELCFELNDDTVCVGYNNLVGPVNHNLSDDKYNILLHILIHTIDDLHNFLPLTHQLKYCKYHTIICGNDYLDTLVDDYSIDYLLGCHEGIDYCIDMLKRDVYKYLEWVVDGNAVKFVYKEAPNNDDMKYELIFYSIKNIMLNMYEIMIVNAKLNISLENFVKRLVYTEQEQFLTSAVLLRNEEMIDTLGDERNQCAISYLEHIRRIIQSGEAIV